MTDPAHTMFLERRVQLERAGEQWQHALAYGDEHIGWLGDRALVLYWAKLTDEIEVWYELPNQEPKLVFKVPAEGFDIKKVCTLLRDADHRRHSRDEIIAKTDAHNAKLDADAAVAKQESLDAANEKLGWAIRKDTGNHIAPLLVTKNAPRVGSARLSK